MDKLRNGKMNYGGKLYGKVNGRYFPLELTLKDVDKLQNAITDMDIATVEALHDLLLDSHGYSLDHITLTRARELTKKMYSIQGYGTEEK